MWTNRIRDSVWSDDRLLMLHRRTDASDNVAIRDDLDFVEASATDADRYARDIGTESPETFRARLSANTRCFMIVDGDRVVHTSWLTTAAAWTREVRRYFVVPPRSAYVYESYTRPEVRGRGVYPYALHRICAWLAERDVPVVWIGIEADNPPSYRAVTKAGFEVVFDVSYARRAGRLTVRIGAGAPSEDVFRRGLRGSPPIG
jgi:GNAT superfamily N-acetyltransferase